MAQEESGVERRRRSPWGALALVMLTGLALMRNGADVTMGPPQAGLRGSADQPCGDRLRAVGRSGRAAALRARLADPDR